MFMDPPEPTTDRVRDPRARQSFLRQPPQPGTMRGQNGRPQTARNPAFYERFKARFGGPQKPGGFGRPVEPGGGMGPMEAPPPPVLSGGADILPAVSGEMSDAPKPIGFGGGSGPFIPQGGMGGPRRPPEEDEKMY